MSILSTIADALTKAPRVLPDAARAAHRIPKRKQQRRRAGELAPTSVNFSRFSGVYDRGKPTDERIRQHNISIFGKCVTMRADALARAIVGEQGIEGFSVERQTTDGAETVEPTHPWVQLMRRPNPSWGAYSLWHWASRVVDLQGAVHLYVVRDGRGVPEQLWPIFPEWGEVRPKLGDMGQLIGWVYYRGGEIDHYDGSDIVRLRLPDVVNPFETQSLLEQGVYELSAEQSHQEYGEQFYRDGRPPNVYLSFDGEVSVQSSQEAATRVQQGYMGERANKVLALQNGGRMRSPAISPDDLQMLETREMNERRIHTITGVPEALFSKESNRSNAREAQRLFAEYTIQPLAVSYADQMTQALERAFGADPGVLSVVAPDVTPKDAQEREVVNRKRIERGVPPAAIMREQGEEVPDEYADELDRPHLPGVLRPIGGGPDSDFL